jgi:hypothetical protein
LKKDSPRLLQLLMEKLSSMKNSFHKEMDLSKKHSNLSSHLALQTVKILKLTLISLKTMLMEPALEKTHAMMVRTSLPDNDLNLIMRVRVI